MTKRIVIDNLEVGKLVAQAAGCHYNHMADHTFGVVDDTKADAPDWIRGGVIITSYTGSSCFMHVAGRDERWMTRDMLWITFDYIFVQLGCAVTLGVVEATNTHTLRFDLRIGFRELYRIPRMFPSGEGIIVGMTREECRWLTLRPRGFQPTNESGAQENGRW